MNRVEIVCFIIAAVSLIFGVCGIVFPKLTKKGVDPSAILGKVDSGLEVAGKAVDAIKAIAPDTPYINTAEAIIEFADRGAKRAEQLYLSNRISADARNAKAIELTKDLLTAAGVTVTPQIEEIIDGCVEAATFELPQTNTPENEARYAAHSTTAQSEAVETSDPEKTAPAAEAPVETPAAASEATAAAPASVSIDDLNQAAGIINAAIAEKVAAQTPAAPQPASSESGAVAPATNGAV